MVQRKWVFQRRSRDEWRAANFDDPGFLRGSAKTDECEPLLKKYTACLNVSSTSRIVRLSWDPEADGQQKALKEKGIDTMLEDARNDMADADSEHLNRK
ncbi:MAG: Mitochondrial distribution and morphology protein 35 [Ramalina farinacea]|uniref:Mitochondrial distribution and morphology protein 35 n=1 Tax=Ramalina farinacea TaxID=258253 RepID=A0AA43QGM9_9LECA|nr:Mitochondrial distribution and morphology protein 35 [Ramalina farinacea]